MAMQQWLLGITTVSRTRSLLIVKKMEVKAAQKRLSI
jgi:hypothetical protein